MRFFPIMLLIGVVCGATLLAQGQQTGGAAPANSNTVLRVETRQVLVDVVAVDKKGNYIRDLTAGDFRVWEDDKEQPIKSFSVETSGSSPANSPVRYLVLFFDNATMTPADQISARKAAARFIEANAGPNRMMAVVGFSGTLRVAQNFTDDVGRLKQAVGGANMATVETASTGTPSFSLGAAAADFGVRSDLIALRNLARGLADVPGRKTLVWLTSGFLLDPQLYDELKAAISECNKANVSVYPIDVRGLMASNALPGFPGGRTGIVSASLQGGGGPFLQMAAAGLALMTFPVPQPGGAGDGGAGGGGGQRSGSPGSPPSSSPGSSPGRSPGSSPGSPGPGSGNRGGTPTSPGKNGGGTTNSGNNNNNYNRNNYNPNSPLNNNLFTHSTFLIPAAPGAQGNQQVMYMLAQGTGGFVILNTNDLLGALQRIAKDQDQYYLIGYEPPETSEGSCHSLRVKVNRGGIILRSRSAYCNVPPKDLLAGSQIEKDLERRVAATEPGDIAGSVADPFFYISPNTARVSVAMEIPVTEIKTEKVKGKLHAEVHILGIAYKADGKAGARFSDTMKLDFDNKKELEAFAKKPLHYENEFDVAAGSYTLKLAFSMGRKFGKIEAPLVVEAWDGKHFGLSSVVFSKSVHRLDQAEGLDTELLQGRTPLVAQGVEITPAATNRIEKAGLGVLYVEVYEPFLLEPNPPRVGLQLRLLDRKTGKVAHDGGLFSVDSAVRAGSPVIPVALKLPVESLAPGAYRAELRATDSMGRQTVLRATDFDLEP